MNYLFKIRGWLIYKVTTKGRKTSETFFYKVHFLWFSNSLKVKSWPFFSCSQNQWFWSRDFTTSFPCDYQAGKIGLVFRSKWNLMVTSYKQSISRRLYERSLSSFNNVSNQEKFTFWPFDFNKTLQYANGFSRKTLF